MKHSFKAKIYKTGINWCVDVPARISKKLVAEKGYIRIRGEINHFAFKQTLVPVRNAPYRLFVNGIMMKGGKTALGKVAAFVIEQNDEDPIKAYPMPALLKQQLDRNKLAAEFDNLIPSRKKDILRYLNQIKTEETLIKNVDKVIAQLKSRQKPVRIP